MGFWFFFAVMSLVWAALVASLAGLALLYTYLVGWYYAKKRQTKASQDRDAVQ